jgi:1,4-alpha-glucan branching enzyme
VPVPPAADAVVYVQFLLEAPSATSVAVAGDFSDWEPAFALQDPDGDGVWSARVPVQPGVHAYMFLVDDTSWQTDPNAGRYQDDGFGNRNAVLAVGASS